MILLRNLFLPLSLLVGTIIGAGIFSLPYAIAQSGIISGIFFLVLIAVLATMMHLMYSDIILRTPNHHNRFPGYAKTYLGNYAGIFATIIIFTTLLLTLTAYLALSVSFTTLLFPSIPDPFRVFIFWILGSFAIFLDIKKAATFELSTTALTLIVIAIIFSIGFLMHPVAALDSHIFSNWQFKHLFAPFGPALFSILGLTAIPPILVYAREEKLNASQIKKVIIWGTIIPAIFYLLFVLGIWGLSKNITMDSVSGLLGIVPPYVLTLLGLFGFISLWDSYAAIGTDVKKNLEYEEVGFSKFTIAIIVIFTPLMLYFIGLQNFLALVSIIGGILFSLRAIITIFIWKKAVCNECEQTTLKHIPSWALNLFVLIFIVGIAYQLVKFI